MRSNAKYSLRKVRGRRGKGTKKKKKVCCFNCKHSYALKCFHCVFGTLEALVCLFQGQTSFDPGGQALVFFCFALQIRV